MLKFLAIQNVVLIDKAEIDFSDNPRGLCVLSGETGSGKSILLDAFGLAIGFRSSLRLIGSDENKASVVAEFEISENENCKILLKENDLIDAQNPNQLRIRRVIQENSANKVYINDQIVGVNLLAKIGETLVEIHGQHDSRGLLNPSFHEDVLDKFSQNDNLLKKIKQNYDELKNCENKISQLEEKKAQALREKDYLEYIIKELETADVIFGEEKELANKKDLLGGKEKILNFLSDLKSNLSDANGNLAASQKILIKSQNIIDNYLSSKKEDFDKLSDEIDSQNIEIEKSIKNIENITRDLKSGNENLSEIEERLLEIRSLARKFNTSCDELPKITADAQEKLKLIENESEFSDSLNKKKQELSVEYKKIAEELHQKRKKYALILAKKVEEELKFLKMESVKFLVDVKKIDEDFGPTGFDKIRFFASINHNNFDEITKIASGGELSRFMLALKVALVDVKSTPTLIFDEIDTGIGGITADAVGKRLKILSQNFQIFVVTHQPQIASKADLHFRIQKLQNKNKIKTVIEKLDKDSQNLEIARMISGEEITQESLAAAKILLKN